MLSIDDCGCTRAGYQQWGHRTPTSQINNHQSTIINQLLHHVGFAWCTHSANLTHF